MTTVHGKGAPVRTTIDQTQWASSVKNTARSLELGMKTLQSLVLPDGRVPGGLFAATHAAMREGVELLTKLLDKRFDVTMSKGSLGMLGIAQRALERADSKFHQMDKQIDEARIPPGSVPWKGDSWFGSVDNAAAKLTEAARADGKPHHVDFNGTFLIALPGQSAADVVSDWSTARGGSKNPLSGLSYKVEQRAIDESTRKELDALAKKPPRPLQQVLGDLDKLVAKGEYGHQMMAGLCELKHPKEIRAFVEQVLEHPPKKDASQSTDSARKIAGDNITFWVRDREGAARGTEQTWLKALADVQAERAKGGGRPPEVKPAAPRAIGDILGELQKLVDKKQYGFDFMAGLCELKDPGDIKTFVRHFLEHPPKKDPSQSTDEARGIAQKNILFWARDREGTAPGTKQTWLNTLDDVVKERAKAAPPPPVVLSSTAAAGAAGASSLPPLKFEPMAGTTISRAVADMVKLANEKGRTVVGSFNGIELTARPGDTPDQVSKPFDDKMAESARRYEAAQQAAQQARAKRLDDAVKGGLKIVETPPAGMTFDARALIPPNGFMNHSSRPLQLITEAQLKQLPDGTQLTSISGDKAIKGVDNIDTDTRGGFIAFGFLQ